MSAQNSINQLLKHFFDKKVIGVEIGVHRGSTSFGLLKSSKINHLYMIDPWQSGYSLRKNRPTDRADKSQKWMNAAFKKVSERAKQFPNKTTIIRKTSAEAAAEVPNDLDFVFIDGDHAYEAVYNDLIIWTPKVKNNGLVCGHDWSNGWKNVIKAVTQYIQDYDPFLPPMKGVTRGRPVPYKAPIINRTWQTVWWGIKKPSTDLVYENQSNPQSPKHKEAHPSHSNEQSQLHHNPDPQLPEPMPLL